MRHFNTKLYKFNGDVDASNVYRPCMEEAGFKIIEDSPRFRKSSLNGDTEFNRIYGNLERNLRGGKKRGFGFLSRSNPS